MKTVHTLLKRQLEKAALLPSQHSPEINSFLAMIDEVYHQFDSDRINLERSLDLSSRELFETNARMQAIFQAFPDILLVVDGNGCIIDYKGNPEVTTFFSGDMLLNKPFSATQLPKIFPGLEAAFNQTIQLQKIGPLTSSMHTEPEDRCYELRMEAVKDLGVIFIIRDISGIKRIQKALALERERLWVTLESISEGVVTTNTEGRITLMNRHAETITALPSDQALGRQLCDVLHIVLANGPDFSEIITGIVNGQAFDLSRFTPKLIRPDNRQLDIFCSGSPIFGPQFRILGAVFILSDITHRRHIEEEILNIKKIESIGILAGGIAHDFNNILTGILGNISLARLYAQKGKDFDEKLNSAEQASIRAQELTQQFLTFSRGGTPVKRSESIVELLQESAQFLLRGSNTIGRFKFEDDLWQAHIDKGQVTQVINNLIINARQAMPLGGVLTISARNIHFQVRQMSALDPGDYICITVKDQGIGIPAENLGKIFDPYFSTKPEGTGLGLTSSFHIVKRHGGLITVESEQGIGSVFDVFLPATRQKPENHELSREIPRGSGTIIIMDDDQNVVDVVDHQLSHLGYQVISVENSQELIMLFNLAEETGLRFDMIVLDLTIPGDIGGEISLKKVRDIDPGIKAIVFSGYSNNPVMAAYREFGFNGKVGKPFLVSELATEVKRVLTSETVS